MGKVIIKTCVKKETAKGTFYTIELTDGRSGSSFSDLTDKMGQEVDLDIKEGKEYEGKMQYYFNVPKQGGQQGGKFPPKDWQFAKRQVALECSVELTKSSKLDVSSKEVLVVAERFFEFLNTK